MKLEPCWFDTAPAWTETPHEVPGRVDVAVVGAGYSGLSAARVIARSGASVAVFEKDTLGAGASGRNTGQVVAGAGRDATDLVRRFGRQRARALFAATVDAVAAVEQLVREEAIDCEFARVGHLQAAATPTDFERFKTEQETLARDFRHDVRLVPHSLQDTEIASQSCHGLLLDETSAAIHPVKYLQGLARAAVAAGAHIHERTPVTRVVRRGVGFEVVAGGRTVVTRDVVASPSGYVDRAMPELARRVRGTAWRAIATEPLDQGVADALLPHRRVAFTSTASRHQFRVSGDRRLVFAGAAKDVTALQRAMLDLFPQLRDARVEYAWSGNVDVTRDRMPHAGLLDGVHYAIGYGGYGIALATYLGTHAGQCLLGVQADTAFHDLRFERIPLWARWR